MFIEDFLNRRELNTNNCKQNAYFDLENLITKIDSSSINILLSLAFILSLLYCVCPCNTDFG